MTSTKINAIDAQLASTDNLSAQAITSLRRYKAHLEAQAQPKPAYEQFKIPAAVVGGVALLLVLGSLFSGSRTPEVASNDSSVDTPAEVASEQPAFRDDTYKGELAPIFNDYLRSEQKRLATAPSYMLADADRAIADFVNLTEAQALQARSVVEDELNRGSSVYIIAMNAARTLEQDGLSPQLSLYLAQSVLVQQKMATPLSFQQ